jgi:hypothetical protein
MAGLEPEICRQIQSERRFGHTRCGVIEGELTLAAVASGFGLLDQADAYIEIERTEATSIAISILSRDLAYDTEIMSPARAAALWQQFLQGFNGQTLQLFSNGRSGCSQWSPATKSTFDMGVLTVGESSSGCLWVEDED